MNLKVLALSGSLRRDSFNTRLLAVMAEAAPDGIDIVINDDIRLLPLFDEDLEGDDTPAAVEHFRRAVAEADALVIASPEYLHSIPGGLKNALDWVSRGEQSPLIGKPVALIGATTGSWGTRLGQAALRQVLYACEALVMPGPNVFMRDAGANFAHEDTRQLLHRVAAALAIWTRRVAVAP